MKRTTLELALLTTLGATFFVPLACGSKPAANASFSYGGDAGPAQACAPGQPCPPPQTGCAPGQPCPAASAAPCQAGQPCQQVDPNQLGGMMQAASAALGQLGGDAVDLGLKAAAAQYAPGWTPETQVAKATLAENGHSYFVVNMDASKCYTIVGYGAGVQDLDLILLAPPLYTLSAAQDGQAGPTAAIQKTCPVIPFAVPYKVDIYAKRGGGPVGAQVFSKPK